MDTKKLVLFLIWLMMLVAYFDRIDIAVAGPSMVSDLHLAKWQFGLVLSAFTLGYAVMQIPGGRLADRFGSRPVLLAAILIWSFFTSATGFAASLAALIAIRILFGTGEGIEIGAQFKLIGDYFEPKERSHANAIFLSALALGPAIGTPLAAWLIGYVGWRSLFHVFAVLGVVVAGILFVLLPKGSGPSRQETGTPGELLKALRQPRACLCFAAYLFYNATFWGFLSWIPTYLNSQRHLSLKDLGLKGAAPYLCGFIGMLAAGYLGATVFSNKRALLVAGCNVLASAALLWALTAPAATECLVGLSVAGFFLFASFGPFWAIAVGLAPASGRGAFSGFVNFGGQVGAFTAQILIGWLADSMNSFNGAILLMCATIVVSALIMLAVHTQTRSATMATS